MRNLLTAIVLGSLVVPTVALAQDPNAAERLRLEDEMKKLSARNAWDGVENNYDQLEALKTTMTYEDYFLGSESARYLGKTLEEYTRLQAAKKLQDNADIDSEISGIEGRYGRVDIRGNPRRTPQLDVAAMPFAPDERKSVEYGQSVVAGAGSFKGMLPEGDYTVGDQKFSVKANQDFAVITVGKAAGVKREGVVIYAGPVVDLGYAYSLSGAPGAAPSGDATTLQPGSVGGSGIGLDAGAEIGFTQIFGVAGTLGYTGMYGANVFHGLDGWLAAAIRPGDLRIAIGPTYGYLHGSGLGVADWWNIGQDPKKFPSGQLPYKGYSLAGGAKLQVAYGVLDLGSLQGMVALDGDWQYDGVRSYVSFGLRVGIMPKVPRFKG